MSVWEGSSRGKRSFLTVGDVVRIQRDCICKQFGVTSFYYRRHTLAKLVRETTHGWWCDFAACVNPPGAVRHGGASDACHGPRDQVWFVNRRDMVLA